MMIDISKEWFERKAREEGDHEIGAGSLTGTINASPAQRAEYRRLAFEALPKWAQDELNALAYEAAKPVPASGGVEAASGIGLRIAAKYAVGGPGIRLAKEIADAISAERAALASSTPAEAEAASSPATTEGVRGEDWSYAFDSDTLRDRFGGSFMAAEPDENGNVAVLLSRADAHAIVAALSPAPAETSTSGEDVR